LVFSKFSGSVKFGFFSGGGFPNLCFSKIGSCFWFKKFRVKFAQVSKISFVVFAQVLASKRFHFAKSVFHGLRFFGQSQVCKIGFKVFCKCLGKFSSGFFARLIFSGKVIFPQSQFLAKVSASSRLWRFGKSVSVSKTKSGL